MKKISETILKIKRFIDKFNNDNMDLYSGAMAYSFISTIVPLMIAVILTAGIIFGRFDPSIQQTIIKAIENSLPQSSITTQLIEQVTLKLSKASFLVSIVMLAISLYSGSRLFILLERAFSQIYGFERRRIIRQNLVSVGMVILLAMYLPLTIVIYNINSLIDLFLKKLLVPIPVNFSFYFQILSLLTSLLSWIIFFFLIYAFVPEINRTKRNILPGALTAGILLDVYIQIFPIYTSKFLSGYVGQIGLIIMTLVFFYYFSYIMLIGAEINGSVNKN